MAWAVELCLFALSLSLAAFNITFGIKDPEGDLITGSFLAVGWVVIAVIELAIIPMAGSMRLAKGINKAYATVGLAGLLFLSAFTVYEFNEIASEYMTRGARSAAITVEKLENKIATLETEIEEVNSDQLDLDQRKNVYSAVRNKSRLIEEQRYKEKQENTKSYYAELITEANRNSEYPIYNPAEKSRLDRIDSRVLELNAEIETLKSSRDEIVEENTNNYKNSNKSKIEQLRSEISEIEENIKECKIDKEKRITAAEGGLFVSKESRVEEIQKQTSKEILNLQESKRPLEAQIVDFQQPPSTPQAATEIEFLISEIETSIAEEKEKAKEIEVRASARMDSPEYQARVTLNYENENRLFEDRSAAMANESKVHEEKMSEIDLNYEASINSLESSTKNDAERNLVKDEKQSSISALKEQINEIIEGAAHKFERTMYFRMATWFSAESSTGFGKLPTREDYNKSLVFIFAPIGLFFGITSIILAYLGTGFMFDEARRLNPEIDIDAIKTRNDELESLHSEYERTKELLDTAEKDQEVAIANALKDGNDKVEILNAQLSDQNKLRNQVESLKMQVVSSEESLAQSQQAYTRAKKEGSEKIDTLTSQLSDQAKLKGLIESLKEQLASNEEDLIKAKQRVFEAIRSIPQSITITDESKDGDRNA